MFVGPKADACTVARASLHGFENNLSLDGLWALNAAVNRPSTALRTWARLPPNTRVPEGLTDSSPAIYRRETNANPEASRRDA